MAEQMLHVPAYLGDRAVLVYEMANYQSRSDRYAVRINEDLGFKQRWYGGRTMMFLELEEAYAAAFAWLYLGEDLEYDTRD